MVSRQGSGQRNLAAVIRCLLRYLTGGHELEEALDGDHGVVLHEPRKLGRRQPAVVHQLRVGFKRGDHLLWEPNTTNTQHTHAGTHIPIHAIERSRPSTSKHTAAHALTSTVAPLLTPPPAARHTPWQCDPVRCRPWTCPPLSRRPTATAPLLQAAPTSTVHRTEQQWHVLFNRRRSNSGRGGGIQKGQVGVCQCTVSNEAAPTYLLLIKI